MAGLYAGGFCAEAELGHGLGRKAGQGIEGFGHPGGFPAEVDIRPIHTVIDRVVADIYLLGEGPFEEFHRGEADVEIFIHFVVGAEPEEAFRLKAKKRIVFIRHIYGHPGIEDSIVEDTHAAYVVVHFIIASFHKGLATCADAHGAGRDIEGAEGYLTGDRGFVAAPDHISVFFLKFLGQELSRIV